MITAAENNRKSVCSRGMSGPRRACTVSEPRPDSENTYSMVIAPPMTKPRLRKISVVVGSMALGTACLRRTSSSRRPLARAVCR